MNENITQRFKESYRKNVANTAEGREQLRSLISESHVPRDALLTAEGLGLASGEMMRLMAADDVWPTAVAGIGPGIALATAISLLRYSLRLNALADSQIISSSELPVGELIDHVLPPISVLTVYPSIVHGVQNLNGGPAVLVVDSIGSGRGIKLALDNLKVAGVQIAWIGSVLYYGGDVRQVLPDFNGPIRWLFDESDGGIGG